jgi:hypothetical protein
MMRIVESSGSVYTTTTADLGRRRRVGWLLPAPAKSILFAAQIATDRTRRHALFTS